MSRGGDPIKPAFKIDLGHVRVCRSLEPAGLQQAVGGNAKGRRRKKRDKYIPDRVYIDKIDPRSSKKINLEGLPGRARHQRAETERGSLALESDSQIDSPTLPTTLPNHNSTILSGLFLAPHIQPNRRRQTWPCNIYPFTLRSLLVAVCCC